MATIKLQDGYNGKQEEFDSQILERMGNTYKVAVAGKPWLIKWVSIEDYDKAMADVVEQRAPQLYDEIVINGIPYAHHCSDLYLPATDKVREILSRYPLEKKNATTFTNRVEGGTWYDIPFAYLPYWQGKAAK